MTHAIETQYCHITHYHAEADIKVKLKNLRTQYTREKQKQRKKKPTGTGADSVYKTKWIHYQSLQFLDDGVTPRHTISNTDSAEVNFMTL